MSIVINRRTVPSLKKTIQLYKAQLHRLEAKHDQLLLKRADLNSRAFVVGDENRQANKSDSRPARHTVGNWREGLEQHPLRSGSLRPVQVWREVWVPVWKNRIHHSLSNQSRIILM